MDTLHKSLRPYKDVDVALVDDCPFDKFSDATPDHNAPSPPQQEVDEDAAEFVKWWTRIRTQRIKREPVLAVIHGWSEDRRRNATLVRKAMFARAALMSILSIPGFGSGCYILLLAAQVFYEPRGILSPFFLLLVGAWHFAIGVAPAYEAAVSAHIAHRIHRSLRAVDVSADDARIYIPPAAILVGGTRSTRRPPFYEPVPFVACEDVGELGMRIRELEVSLRADDREISFDLLGLEWPGDDQPDGTWYRIMACLRSAGPD